MASTDLHSNIVLGADVSGVESGMARGKRAVEDLGNVAERAGRRASEGLSSVGRGGDNAARTVERATRSLEQQIQRQIASMQAGSRESRQYWESLANQRGISSQALRPVLDQLEAARAKTAQATEATTNWRTEITKVGPVLASVFAAVSFTAFAAKLISVQREIDVLNSSLVTVTGSSAAAERELAWLKDFASETPFGLAQATEGFIKMKSLGLDPTRAALTSFGNTSAAMGKSLNQMIEAVADASTGEFERLKEFGIKAKQEGAQVSLTFQGVTTTIGNNAKEITKYLQAIGDTQFAGAMETRAKTLDGAISELGDTWDELFRTINTNNTGSLIYDSVLLASGAVKDLTTILAAMNSATDENTRATGAMKTVQEGIAVVLETVAVVGVTVASTLTGVGREIGALAAQVVALATLDISGFKAIGQAVKEDAIAARKEWEATVDRILNARNVAANRPKAQEPDRPAPKPAPRTDDTDNKAAANAYKTFIESIKEKIALEQAELASGAKLTESQRLRVKVEQELTGARKANALQLVDQLANIERIQKTAQTEAAEAGEAAKAYADLIEARQNSIAGLANQIQREREAAAAIGLSRTEVAGLEVAKLEEAAADKERRASMLESTVADKEAAKLYREEAKALRDLAAAKRGTAEKEEAEETAKAAGEAAKKASEEWQRYTDDINKSLTDALLRGFEDGKGFAQNLRDTTENMFKTLILRPTISAIMEPVSGTISSVLGTGSSTGGGILGMIKDGKSLYDMGTKAYSWFTGANAASGVTSSLGAAFYTAPALYAGSAALAGTATTALAGGALGSGTALGTGALLGSSGGVLGTGTALLGTGGTGVAIGSAGTASALTSVGSAAASSAPATSALAGMGPYGWIAAAAILAVMAFAGKGEKRYGGQYGVNFEGDEVINGRRGTTVSAERGTIAFLEGPSGGDYAGETARKLITGTTQGINTLLKDLGSGMALTGFQAGLETSTKGRGGVYSGGTLTGGITFGESGTGDNYRGTLFEKTSTRSPNAEEAVKNFATDMLQVTIQALQAATDLPKAIKAQLTGIDAEKLTDEAATELLNSIQAQIDYVKSLRDTLNQLPFANLKDVAFDTAAGLTAAAGGIEALNQNITGYFSNYFTEQEQRTAAIARVSSAFTALGLVMPDVAGDAEAARASFRAMAEGINVSTEAGQKQYAGILALQGAFAELTPVIDKTAEAARQAESVLQQRQQLEMQLLQLQGNTAEIRSRELAALLTDENRAIQQAIYALQDKQTADAAAKAAQDAADRVKAAWQSVGDTLVDEIKRIRGEAATSGTEGLAYAQSAFAVATAQARAGDQEAASSLPELSRTVLELAEKTASSAVDLKIFQAQIAASLMETTKAIAASQGTTVPAFAAGGAHSGGWAMVGEQGPELAYMPPARIYTASQSAGMLGDVQGLQDEMRRMREDLRHLGDSLATLQLRNARAAEASQRLLEDVTEGGAAMRTTEVTP
ncbi:hypothetical protein GCM10007320_61440 [Pseudorhodoferax aquiterrae]|uniref:Tape measure protein N-terminal domain-containing protein n=1 Tax=Pseudorhodoferax aquiterrae TaxID=747304 RepID=A0ABQ3GD77_9BURK|nr:tape measure protein [Pseudorhodoferax aquiterrae]GHD02308.1 hypothetical protein GCM10007320_61440 [Pseudorhodoferax aquiterrae]